MVSPVGGAIAVVATVAAILVDAYVMMAATAVVVEAAMEQLLIMTRI